MEGMPLYISPPSSPLHVSEVPEVPEVPGKRSDPSSSPLTLPDPKRCKQTVQEVSGVDSALPIDEPCNQTHSKEPSHEPSAEHKKRVHRLWSWYRSVGQQRVTHLGDESTTYCWDELFKLKKKDLLTDMAAFDKMFAVQQQYGWGGFTEKASR